MPDDHGTPIRDALSKIPSDVAEGVSVGVSEDGVAAQGSVPLGKGVTVAGGVSWGSRAKAWWAGLTWRPTKRG